MKRYRFYATSDGFVEPKEDPAVPERLRALLEGLECEEIDNLMQQSPETLKAVGVEIAKAAKLGAHLYASSPSISHGGKS